MVLQRMGVDLRLMRKSNEPLIRNLTKFDVARCGRTISRRNRSINHKAKVICEVPRIDHIAFGIVLVELINALSQNQSIGKGIKTHGMIKLPIRWARIRTQVALIEQGFDCVLNAGTATLTGWKQRRTLQLKRDIVAI